MADPHTSDSISRSDGPPTGNVDLRRYTITGLLGRGGFGTVYKGRLDGGEGFVKDVAIKLLSDREPPDDVLGRFRDEARILGLLRDRNIVSVDPPTRLGGHWAVVMEFVDGAACDRLLKKLGPLPTPVALEIVEEIARTLDNMWSHPGPNEQPMHLLHRDIKPPNIQVTPNGQVKLLDFGIAKADFGNRETLTTNHIGGTMGYIAPERLEGEEGDRGDVYSLGVVLHELITGRRPVGSQPPRAGTGDPYRQAALELSALMRSMEPAERPSAREVEKRSRDIRARGPGPDLRDWAKAHVPHASVIAPDELVGKQLTETIRGIPVMPSTIPTELRPRSRGWSIGAVIGGLVVVLVVGGLVLAGGVLIAGGAAMISLQPTSAPEVVLAEEGPDGTPDEPAPAPVEAPEPAPEPSPVPAPSEAPVAPAPAPRTPAPAPSPSPAPAPAPAPAAGGSGTVVVTGDADKVTLVSGSSRLSAGELPAGEYEVRAVFGGAEVPAGKITLATGGTVTLKCMAAFKRCQTK